MLLNRNIRKDGRTVAEAVLIVGAVIAVIAMGCCGNGDEKLDFDLGQGLPGNTVTFHFTGVSPFFFAWKDGDSPWEAEEVTEAEELAEVEDSAEQTDKEP